MTDTRLCPTCARPIPKSKSRLAVRCSSACAQREAKMRREGFYGPPKPYRPVNCLYCEEPLPEGSLSGKIYCGDKCRSAFRARDGGHLRYFDLVFQRDNGRCYLCGEVVAAGPSGSKEATLDHLLPVSPDTFWFCGTDHPVNLGIAHRGCNSRKKNRILAKAIEKLQSNIASNELGYESYTEGVVSDAYQCLS